MNDVLKEKIGVVVLAPPSLAETLRSRFKDELSTFLFIHETTNASQLKLVNKQNPNQHLVWVSSCTQQNIITGIGVHKAIMVGYARNANSNAQNTQKFNCHKLSEFEIGIHSKTEGLSNTMMPELFKLLVDKNAHATKGMLEKVEFYSELLQDEADSKMDIEYWIDYVDKFNVGHKIPLYDHMSFIKYHNIELWGFIAFVLYLIYCMIYYVVRAIWRCICGKKKEVEAKVKQE